MAMTAQALAYGPQVPHTITVTPSSGTFLCEHPTAVTATVLDQDGLPIKGVTVTWSFSTSPSSDDRILQQTSKTNTDGVAKTMVKLACVAGDRVITATAGGVSGSATVHVDLGKPGKPQGAVLGITATSTFGDATLPDTTTASGVPGGDASALVVPSALVIMLLILAFAGTFLLRRSFRPR
jgi:hypothetical protein